VSTFKIKISSKNMREKPITNYSLGTLPDDGNVMPKHVGATIHNE
jgi:hypothetical protein